MTAITNVQMLSPWAAYGTTGSLADFPWTAGTLTPGVGITCTGRQVILVWNTHGANPYTVTFTSQDDEQNRAASITYTLAAGDFASFGLGLTNSKGWQTAAKLITVLVSNVAVKIAVLTLPDGYP